MKGSFGEGGIDRELLTGEVTCYSGELTCYKRPRGRAAWGGKLDSSFDTCLCKNLSSTLGAR
ncbi:hypothetical protein KPP10_gp078 [Pseudomonas phage KPP10]|uniref:Uncharacterized protein n=1 Tax=Pseudomonas phage KPP10 TaxID=582345 RepID=D6RRN2_BPKPP|nr:hypothetical protein KPP10_gp078 [Pseudomonas phage KPP10]BAJ09197.1 hypothetical protein [Pseudomonas phage KPP10]